MPKFYDMEGMTQEHLNKIGLERNTFAKEIERLNNIIKEKNKLISNIISKIEKVVIETKIYQQDRELSVEEVLKELYEAKDLESQV